MDPVYIVLIAVALCVLVVVGVFFSHTALGAKMEERFKSIESRITGSQTIAGLTAAAKKGEGDALSLMKSLHDRFDTLEAEVIASISKDIEDSPVGKEFLDKVADLKQFLDGGKSLLANVESMLGKTPDSSSTASATSAAPAAPAAGAVAAAPAAGGTASGPILNTVTGTA